MKVHAIVKTGEFSYKRERMEILEKEDQLVICDKEGKQVDEKNVFWLYGTDRDILDNVLRIAFQHIISMMPKELILSEDSPKHLHGIMDAYLEKLYEVGEKSLLETRKDILENESDLPYL